MITNENKHKKGIKNYNCDEDKKHIKEYNNASWNFLEKNKEIHREMTQRIGNEERIFHASSPSTSGKTHVKPR